MRGKAHLTIYLKKVSNTSSSRQPRFLQKSEVRAPFQTIQYSDSKLNPGVQKLLWWGCQDVTEWSINPLMRTRERCVAIIIRHNFSCDIGLLSSFPLFLICVSIPVWPFAFWVISLLSAVSVCCRETVQLAKYYISMKNLSSSKLK